MIGGVGNSVIKISLNKKNLIVEEFWSFYIDLILRIKLIPNIKFSIRKIQFSAKN